MSWRTVDKQSGWIVIESDFVAVHGKLVPGLISDGIVYIRS